MRDRPSLQWVDLSLDGPQEEIDRSLRRAADHLACGAIIGVHLGIDGYLALERARQVAETIRSCLIERHGLPSASYVEIDEESRGVPVAPFQQRRFLLPHQDGGHCSFLTPSRLDSDKVDAEDRVFSSSIYWRRPSHKLFQGFLVTNPGEPVGTTYYYSALALLRLAFSHRFGRQVAHVSELAGFALENVRRARSLRDIHGSRYLTPGAFLGSPNPAHHVLPSGPRAESHFWPEQYAAIPELFDIAAGCSCGTCEGPGARALCHAFEATLGLTWPEVRARFEISAAAQRFDLLIANNLTLFHAAESGRTRTLVPICIVTDEFGGSDYEQWLAQQWRHGTSAAYIAEQHCEM